MNKIIAIVGMCGSGKSITTDLLEKRGWNKVYFGGLVYDKMNEEGIPITPETQKEYREKIRKEHGMAAVAKLLYPKIQKCYEEKNTVLDGLYSWDEYKFLKEKLGDNFYTIAVVCDKNIRYERLENRVERPFNNEEAQRRDLTEIENIAKAPPIAYADYFIFNNGTTEEYEERLNTILKDIERRMNNEEIKR